MGRTSRSARATAAAASSTAASTSRPRWCGRPTWPRSSSTRRWRWPTTSTRRGRSCSTSIPARRPTIVECCQIALRGPRRCSTRSGCEGWCKTSGSKGLQMYVPLNTPGATHDGAADFALAVGQVLERQLPGRVTTMMAKAERPGKIFVDWSQNALHKTTIAPYSLRARPEPTVSTPVDVGRGRGVRRRRDSSCGSPPTTCSSGSTSSATCSPTCSPSCSRFPAADGARSAAALTPGGRGRRSGAHRVCNC